MLYKMLNEYQINPFTDKLIRYIDENGKNTITTHPTDEFLKTQGYKPLQAATIPEYDTNTQYIVRTYSETTEAIIETITVKEQEANNE